MLLGRKPEAGCPVPACGGGGAGGGGAWRGALPGAGVQSDVFNRPTDVAWDAAGNIFVADGCGNARVAKFDSNGVFVKSWGSSGTGPGMFGTVTAIAVDAQGNVYAADGWEQTNPGLRQRRNLQDASIPTSELPGALHHARPESGAVQSRIQIRRRISMSAGEIYKMKLDGTILGKFGRAGKQLKEFGTVNAIDCRSENNLLVGEIGNMRVQDRTLWLKGVELDTACNKKISHKKAQKAQRDQSFHSFVLFV